MIAPSTPADLVERLRDPRIDGAVFLREEAADEITNLRAQLATSAPVQSAGVVEALRSENANLKERLAASERRALKLERNNNRMGRRVVRKHHAMAEAQDMAAVGESLMRAITVYTAEDGPLKDWTPAEDPAEIVDTLYPMLEDREAALAASGQAQPVGEREALPEITEARKRELVEEAIKAFPYPYTYSAQNRAVEIERREKFARSVALHAIKSLEAARQASSVIPVGWQMVPKEPTEAMISAYVRLRDQWAEKGNVLTVRAGYKATLAASPPPTVPGVEIKEEAVEATAIKLWRRFADSSVETWEDETHKAEYRLAAQDILIGSQVATYLSADGSLLTVPAEEQSEWFEEIGR